MNKNQERVLSRLVTAMPPPESVITNFIYPRSWLTLSEAEWVVALFTRTHIQRFHREIIDLKAGTLGGDVCVTIKWGTHDEKVISAS